MTGNHPILAGKRGSEQGFTYLGVLFAVALLGTQLALAGLVWSFAQERQKERELLFVGDQFRTAIARYYLNPNGPQKEYPKRLEDLVRDPRYTGTIRHLRKIYADPITGKIEWGLIKSPDGSILGVYSLSNKTPIKTGNFLPSDHLFENKPRYSDWKFIYAFGAPIGRGNPPLPGSTSATSNGLSSSDVHVYRMDGQNEGVSTTPGTGIHSGLLSGGPRPF